MPVGENRLTINPKVIPPRRELHETDPPDLHRRRVGIPRVVMEGVGQMLVLDGEDSLVGGIDHVRNCQARDPTVFHALVPQTHVPLHWLATHHRRVNVRQPRIPVTTEMNPVLGMGSGYPRG